MIERSQSEFLLEEVSIKIDENGFLLILKNESLSGDNRDEEFSARLPAKGLFKLILLLFQAGRMYQDTFGVDIGFSSLKGEAHEERRTED